jgi:hypothetical protein
MFSIYYPFIAFQVDWQRGSTLIMAWGTAQVHLGRSTPC